jgi:hypothetical protein
MLVIASRGHKTNGLNSSGAAFVFRKAGGIFLYESKLVASVPQAGAAFGTSVAIHGDKIAVGAPYETASTGIPGAAYVFAKTAFTWPLETRIQGPVSSSRFGNAIAIDNDRLAVGAPNDDLDGYLSGAVMTYRFAGSWSLNAGLRGGYGAGRNQIGASVSLSNGRLLVGVRPELNATGSVALYIDSPSGFQRQGISYAGNFGYINGDSAFIGAPYLNTGALNSGGGVFILWASDCNSDGIPDRCNIDLDYDTDINNDGIPDSCQPFNPDVNRDGVVDSADISNILLGFGECSGCPEDVTRDGSVDAGDISYVLISMD